MSLFEGHELTSPMNTDRERRSRVVSIAGALGFILGLVPLVALTFFSPGLRSEGVRGLAVFAWA